MFNISDSVEKETGVPEVEANVIPFDGYGNQEVLRFLIDREKPVAILHYTDPRFWGFLYSMENEIRQNIPIMYYNIWDDLPLPQYNEEFYNSCDLIMNISKQTNNIVNKVCVNTLRTKDDCVYVPHGINSMNYYPVHESDPEFKQFKHRILQGKHYKFVVLYINRNIRRKMPGDLMLAYKQFLSQLKPNEADKCLLIYKTSRIDQHGTDLPAVHKGLMPDDNVIIFDAKIDIKEMNFLYNVADVGMNISSAEGFGLSSAEALMAGTPVINNVTGGLQDQCRFEDNNGHWINFDNKQFSNSDGKYTKCGTWAFPIWPHSNLTGSPPTPYIYDSRCESGDVAKRLLEVYKLGRPVRKKLGKLGREWCMSDESMMSSCKMCENFIKYMENCLNKFECKPRYGLYKTDEIKQPKIKGIYNEVAKRWE